MADPITEETLLASVVLDSDRQLALHRWSRVVKPELGAGSHREFWWEVGLYDNDGNVVATLARIEATTSIAAQFGDSAWAVFRAMVPPFTIAHIRNVQFFDLGSGPERIKA